MAVGLRPKSILLVEDTADDERLALRALSRLETPVKIIIARDGAEALEYLFEPRGKSVDHQPDLVLLDLKLPKVGGIDVLRAIRKSDLHTWLPVIVLTSSDEERDLLDCHRAGCSAYVRKAVNYSEYMECMKTTLEFWIDVNRTPSVSPALSLVRHG